MPDRAFVITWNKKKWPDEKLKALIDDYHAGRREVERWKFASPNLCFIGDRVVLLRIGSEPRGLLGSGRIHSSPMQEPDTADPKKLAWYVDVEFDCLSESPDEVFLHRSRCEVVLGIDPTKWPKFASGEPYPGDVEKLEEYLNILTGGETQYPDEIGSRDFAEGLWEGAAKEVKVNRFERDAKARQECIKAHGATCRICGFDFQYVYGPALGSRLIHVHHLRPLKEIREGYEVDPVNDLIPICPNCHAAIHRTRLPPDELRAQMDSKYLAVFTMSRAALVRK